MTSPSTGIRALRGLPQNNMAATLMHYFSKLATNVAPAYGYSINAYCTLPPTTHVLFTDTHTFSLYYAYKLHRICLTLKLGIVVVHSGLSKQLVKCLSVQDALPMET